MDDLDNMLNEIDPNGEENKNQNQNQNIEVENIGQAGNVDEIERKALELLGEAKDANYESNEDEKKAVASLLAEKEASQQDFARTALMMMAQEEMNTVENENVKERAGITRRPDTAEENVATGQEPKEMRNLKAESTIKRIYGMPSELNAEENFILESFRGMTMQERQNYLNEYDLSKRSIYDPLPDDKAVYQVELLKDRLIKERMYPF